MPAIFVKIYGLNNITAIFALELYKIKLKLENSKIRICSVDQWEPYLVSIIRKYKTTELITLKSIQSQLRWASTFKGCMNKCVRGRKKVMNEEFNS